MAARDSQARPSAHDLSPDPRMSAIASIAVGPDTSPPGIWRSAAMLALACLAFFGVAGLQRNLISYPEHYEIGPKLEHLRVNPGAYDVIYLGSSAVFRHFVPEAFDTRLSELGHELRSFNLGSAALVGLEADRALRDLLAIEGLDVDYIVLDMTTFDSAPLGGGEANTDRRVHWHDFEGTWKVLRLTLEDKRMSWMGRTRSARSHLGSFCWHVANYGQGPRLVAGLMGSDSSEASAPWIVEDRGYLSLEDTDDPFVRARRKKLIENPSELTVAVAALRRARRQGPGGEAGGQWIYREQAEAIRAAGARPLYVIPASLKPTRPLWALDGREGFPPQLSYNDPLRYPKYFELRNHFDKNHLTRHAAKLFSRNFAEDFAVLLGKQ